MAGKPVELTAVGVIITGLCVSIGGDGATRAFHFHTIDGLPAVHVGVDLLLIIRDEHSLEGNRGKKKKSDYHRSIMWNKEENSTTFIKIYFREK